MKIFKFIIAGVLFGIIMSKSGAIHWINIYEMFTFRKFQMYGIIGSAIAVGMLGIYLIERYKVKDFYGEKIVIHPKQRSKYRYIVGGLIFGLGWALTGACPGPMFTLLGAGEWFMLPVIASAILGTFVYGVMRPRLPH